MEEKIIKLTHSLNIIFWGFFVLISSISIIQILIIAPKFTTYINERNSIDLQSIAILILLICIPLALKLYHQKLQKTLPENENKKIALIKKWFIIRTILMYMTLFINIISYSLLQDTSSLFCCGIIILVIIAFCKPNKKEITEILSK